MKLINADVCRDGGSITAEFRLADKSLLSLLLEVSSEGWPQYAHLHAGGEIQQSCDPSTVVARGSLREKKIIALLAKWRDSPSRQPDEYPMERADKENAERWALEMCRRIPERTA
ncbi:hypothetical protein [Comamonas sp. JUb58]|uniref:hypothetical protein n=1 Tax=Comamonas sp. JUb58 TaxID=2485114 RepID=UPI00105D9BEA|nr:hypothetical protein [Comamonas sp. JUb58]